ncbi:MAG TPA: HD domain-containing protein, partial [Candidatus Wirthbacteria bacterium]|nr:HD domain-containing protein [Candidatus Wirthbacteria bacterium]
MKALLDFLLTTQNLSLVPRTGFVMRGVPDPESVAEHSLGVIWFALVLASLIEVDRAEVMLMALL